VIARWLQAIQRLLMLASFFVAASSGPLPELMPAHCSLSGQPDRFAEGWKVC
jgi:hypothetical protein